MLEKLVIWNFQGFQKITIYFDEQITTLWGPTDAGKSSIIRALRWLALNQRPKNHINFDADYTKVTLYVDGHRITRKQSSHENCYFLDGEILKSFVKGVPDQIKDILKVSDTNFQKQHAAHFWVSLSSGEVAKQLNEIVDLTIIDNSAAEINLRIKRNYAQTKVAEERRDAARQRRDSLRWVTDAADELAEIEAKQQKLADLTERYEGIASLVSQVEHYQRRVDKLDKLVTKGQEFVSKTEALFEKRKAIQEQIENIKSIVYEIGAQLKWAQSRKERLSILETSLKKFKHCPICGNAIQS
jgi:exonuclease SbcC